MEVKMKNFIKITAVLFMIVISLFISGCDIIGDIIYNSSTTEVPEESLIITDNIDCITYKYSGKAKILSDHSYISGFNILVNEEDYLWDTLLMGKLEKFAHYEDYLVMIFNGKYYSFDLENYSVPKSEDDLQYDLEEYSEDEFKEKFPQYESFEWRE